MGIYEKFPFLDRWTKPRILVVSLISFGLVATGWVVSYSGFLGTTHAKMAVSSPTHATPVSLLSKAANIDSVNHALAGVRVESVPSDKGLDEGVSVTNVQSGNPADRAGIQKGDIILEINRHSVKGVDAFRRLTQMLGPDDRVLVLLHRGRGTIFLSITPSRRE